MKKIIIGFVIIITFLILSFLIYLNLPFEITRKSDIDYGNSLIENIEKYKKKNNRLPINNDWKTLEELGFKTETLGKKPSYETDNKGNYELIYLEGFDGPYLMWNSVEKNWKIDNPSIFAN